MTQAVKGCNLPWIQILTPMEMLNHIALLVKCPHCGNKFSPEEAIQHDLRAKFEREFEQKLVANTKSLCVKDSAGGTGQV